MSSGLIKGFQEQRKCLQLIIQCRHNRRLVTETHPKRVRFCSYVHQQPRCGQSPCKPSEKQACIPLQPFLPALKRRASSGLRMVMPTQLATPQKFRFRRIDQAASTSQYNYPKSDSEVFSSHSQTASIFSLKVPFATNFLSNKALPIVKPHAPVCQTSVIRL
jgi:hypothetical protein